MSDNLQHEKDKLEAQEVYPEKNMILGYVLLFFLGYFGAHRFYYGKTGTAITQLALTLLGIVTFGLTMIPVAIWVLVDIYFVFKYTEDHNKVAHKNQIEYLEKKATVQPSANHSDSQVAADDSADVVADNAGETKNT